jgi:hypothetical protein
MLVESLALRQPNNSRALAIKDFWLEPGNMPQRNGTLAGSGANYLPAFIDQQMQFFNGDFRHHPGFQAFLQNHRNVDKEYSSAQLGEAYRYGLTAGVSPQGYHADAILNHPNNVFSPEAVAAWGDMDAFLQFYNSRFPTTDPRYKYGLVRQSQTQPNWVPGDAGLVDHLFLLFGLVESLDPSFFADRLFPRFVEGDFDADGDADGPDFLSWQRGESPAPLSAADLATWRTNFGTAPTASAIPEPVGVAPMLIALVSVVSRRRLLAARRG